MIFVLDTYPLGLLSSPNQRKTNEWELSQWVKRAIKNGHIIAIPEICYYESRRELIRCKKRTSVVRLDQLCSLSELPRFKYIPISTRIIVKSSQLWAWARQTGQQTAHDLELDGDVILAATAITVAEENLIEVTVVTNNIDHLARYTTAKHWHDINF